jgi:signal transduction histidine kinase
MAVLPVPDGGRLLLDSHKPCRAGGWIERARPYLELLSMLAGPDWAGQGSLQGQQEVAALDRLFAACQDILARSTASIEDLLEASRRALGADELFLITGQAPTHRIFSSPHRGRAPAAHDLALDIRSTRGSGLDESDIRDLAIVLGASTRAMAGALGREGDEQEVLLAGWAEGPALSSVSMSVAARAFSTARAAVDARRQAVSSLLDRERARMAYALHDGLTQTVTGAVLQLDALAKRIQADPAGALAILETAKTEIRRSLAELRGMLFDLSPSLESEQRHDEPLTRYVEDVVKRWRLPARVAVEGDLTGIPARVLSVAYVVIREALANAAKHAAGQGVTVTLAAGDNDLMVIVGDGGRGFSREDETAAREAHHVGLDLLRRRVGEVGGHLRIESRPGKGTRVIARLPMHGVAS